MINLLHHSSTSAVIELGQPELLLAMALIQEGKDVLGCISNDSKALDQLFVAANILVEQARRQALQKRTSKHLTDQAAAPLLQSNS